MAAYKTKKLDRVASANHATGIQYNGYGLTSREMDGTQTPLCFTLPCDSV
jgi:hypothetical protein